MILFKIVPLVSDVHCQNVLLSQNFKNLIYSNKKPSTSLSLLLFQDFLYYTYACICHGDITYASRKKKIRQNSLGWMCVFYLAGLIVVTF